jgi:hypothetical protein
MQDGCSIQADFDNVIHVIPYPQIFMFCSDSGLLKYDLNFSFVITSILA